MQNTIKILKISSKIHIIAYLCMYAVVFFAYDSSGVFSIEGNNDYQSFLVFVLTMLGIAFTLSMLRYRRVQKETLLVGELILVYDILQMIAMIVAAQKSFGMLTEAGPANDNISMLFSILAIIMSSMIATMLFITVIFDITLGIFKIQDYNITPDHETTTLEKSKSYIHIIVLAPLVATYIFSSLYTYGIFGLLFFMWLFLIAFPLPYGLFFTIIVKEWINNKKYIFAIGACVLYTYSTYGVFYNLFNEAVYCAAYRAGAVHIFGVEGLVGYINVIAGGVATVLLIIKAFRKKQ